MLRAEKVETPAPSRRERSAERPTERVSDEPEEPVVAKTRELYPNLNGTLEAVLLDPSLQEIGRFPISELVQKMQGSSGAHYLIFDGIVTQRLVESAARVGVKGIIGHRTGELNEVPGDVRIGTFRDLGLE
jgi:DNA primase